MCICKVLHYRMFLGSQWELPLRPSKKKNLCKLVIPICGNRVTWDKLELQNLEKFLLYWVEMLWLVLYIICMKNPPSPENRENWCGSLTNSSLAPTQKYFYAANWITQQIVELTFQLPNCSVSWTNTGRKPSNRRKSDWSLVRRSVQRAKLIHRPSGHQWCAREPTPWRHWWNRRKLS